MGKRERIKRHIMGEDSFVRISIKLEILEPEKCKVTGKIKFSKKGVLQAAHVSNRERNYEVFVYKCPFCRYWHRTKTVSRVPNKNKHRKVKREK